MTQWINLQARNIEPGMALVDARALTRLALLDALRPALSGIRVFAVSAIEDLERLEDFHLRAVVLWLGGKVEAEGVRAMITDARGRLGAVSIILLADEDDETRRDAAKDCGASAYLTTATPLDLAAATIRLVVADTPPGLSCDPSPEADVHMFGEVRVRRSEAGRLTAREEDVLRLVGEGAQNKVIAYRLQMSENTVKVHLHRILQKFQLHNRTEAALAAPRYFASTCEKVGVRP